MNRLQTLLIAGGLIATACAPPDEPAVLTTMQADSVVVLPAEPEPDWTGYRGGGNEPFWNIELTESTMEFADLGMDVTASAPRPDPIASADGWRFETTADGQPFVLDIRPADCSDTMSGRPFPHAITVTVSGQTFQGCGGDTAILLTGDAWRVTQMEGNETASTAPTLTFGTDGSLTGNGTCNTFRAEYEITGEGIEISPALATRMACGEDALNQQETRFFSLLEQVTRFDVVEGRLQLYSLDTVVMLADR